MDRSITISRELLLQIFRQMRGLELAARKLQQHLEQTGAVRSDLTRVEFSDKGSNTNGLN